jgi:hypothetical protein
MTKVAQLQITPYTTFAGGLDSKDIVQLPRLRQFRQQLAAAQQYMSSRNRSNNSSNGRSRDSSKALPQWHSTAGPWQETHGVNNSSTNSKKTMRLTEAIASIAGSPQVVTPYQTLLGMPPKK